MGSCSRTIFKGLVPQAGTATWVGGWGLGGVQALRLGLHVPPGPSLSPPQRGPVKGQAWASATLVASLHPAAGLVLKSISVY